MQAFSNYSGSKSFFEKFCFRDGLVWTVGLTGEIKLRFQIPPEQSKRATHHGDAAQLATGAANKRYYMHVICKSDLQL